MSNSTAHESKNMKRIMEKQQHLVSQYFFDHCQDAISKLESKSDFLLFYANGVLGILRGVTESLFGYSFYIVLTGFLGFVLYVLYKAYWKPELYVKELSEIGFDHIPPGPDRARRVARALAAKRLSSKYPPPYPNGWFALVESAQLKIGGVVPVDALGQNLAVYRGEDGVARCVDAYCPHLGANIGVGGTVCGDCIECPFHKWRFSADGELVKVPDLESVPKGVSIKTWKTVEAEGAVWIWHDAEGREPLWEFDEPPEFEKWGFRGSNEFTVNCHIQEIPENGADMAHLSPVHSPSIFSTLAEKYQFLLNFVGYHHWSAEWVKGDDHTAMMKLTHNYKFMKMDLIHLDVKASQIGPGHVRLYVQSTLGPILISQSVTPIGPLQQRIVHRVFSPTYNAVVGAFINRGESCMIERDIVIWNSKCFVSAPAYVRADKTIRAFRNWYSQFYSPKSVSLKDAMQNKLDW